MLTQTRHRAQTSRQEAAEVGGGTITMKIIKNRLFGQGSKNAPRGYFFTSKLHFLCPGRGRLVFEHQKGHKLGGIDKKSLKSYVFLKV